MIHHTNMFSPACQQAPGIFDFWHSRSLWHLEGGEKTRTKIQESNSRTGIQELGIMQVIVTDLSFGLCKGVKLHSTEPRLGAATNGAINGKMKFSPSSALPVRILEEMRLRIIHVRSCELVTQKRGTVETQCSWEFLCCCSRVKLDYFKNPTTLFGNIKEVENIKIHELKLYLYFAFLFFSFKILENNIKTSSK